MGCLDHKAKIFLPAHHAIGLWKVSGLKAGGSWLDKQFIAMNLMRFRQICQATRHKPCHNVFARCQDFCPVLPGPKGNVSRKGVRPLKTSCENAMHICNAGKGEIQEAGLHFLTS